MMTWNSFFFHSPNSFLMEMIIVMHDFIMMILTSVLILVVYNIFFVVSIKNFNFKFFENHQLETVWTLIPFVLLVGIVIPSIESLYMLDSCIFCGITLSVVGRQWYWMYFYKDFADLNFSSYMSKEDNLWRHLRLVDVDNRLVIPTHVPSRFLVTSGDVIHSWTIPSFGVKMDAVPGRLNQFCFSSKRSGVFFGQCSEICGAYHSFMPIVMESVNFKDFIKNF